MILLANSTTKLAATALVFAFVACSKSDSNRTTLGAADQDATSQQEDQDNSAFAPTETTGAFLAGAEIACASFATASISGVHCRLLKGGRSIYNQVRGGSRTTNWSIRINGKDESFDPPAAANLTEQTLWDATWSRFARQPWPSIESPILEVTLRDGTVTRIAKTAGRTEDFAAAVREPSNSSGSNGSSTGGTTTGGSSSGTTDGGSNSGSGSTVGAHTIFITIGKYHSPQDVTNRESPMFANCPDLLSTIANTALIGASRASAVASLICQCEARHSSVEAIRTAANTATSVLNTEENIPLFSQRMFSIFSKKFVDPLGHLIAGPHELIDMFPGSDSTPNLAFTTINPIGLDTNASTIVVSANQIEPIWTGMVESSLGVLVSGEPDCNRWSQGMEDGQLHKARAGAVARKDANAFTGQSLVCGPQGDIARLYCAIP